MINNKNENGGFTALLPAMAVYVVIGMIITLFSAFLLALLVSKGAIPEGARAMTALACLPGAFFAGFFTARRAPRRRLPAGVISGGAFLLLLVLISMVFLPHLEAWSGFWLSFAACIGGSAAGAITVLSLGRR